MFETSYSSYTFIALIQSSLIQYYSASWVGSGSVVRVIFKWEAWTLAAEGLRRRARTGLVIALTWVHSNGPAGRRPVAGKRPAADAGAFTNF